jgi:hypothetical protein
MLGWRAGPLSPCLTKSVAAMTGVVPAGERKVHDVVQRERPHSVVKPQYQEGGTSKLPKGVADLLFGTNPGLCVASRRATIAPCSEALVASLRMITIQRGRVPPGTAWRVDDAPQAWRPGDDCTGQSPAPVDRGAEPAPQRSSGDVSP